MNEKHVPQAARIALQTDTGAVCRHGPDGHVEVVCLASRIESGIWATVDDRGIYGGVVHGERRGTCEVVDLHLHTLEDDHDQRRILPIRWATRSVIRPIALLGVPEDPGQSPEIVPSGDMVEPQYQHIHVPTPTSIKGDSYFGPRRAGDIDLTKAVGSAQGAVFDCPMNQTYRTGMEDGYRDEVSEDRRGAVIDDVGSRKTVCVHADMGNPHDSLLGAPVVDSAGRLAGVVIGAGQGFQYDHVGSYVPADMILTAVQLAKAQVDAARSRGRHSHGIDVVSHYHTDVEWIDECPVREPRNHLDRTVRLVATRRRLRGLIAAAQTGLCDPECLVDGMGSTRDVQETIEDIRRIIR